MLDNTKVFSYHTPPTDRETIYLAGAMDGVSVKWATEWRNRAKGCLERFYNIIDPTAGKNLDEPGIHTSAYEPADIVLQDYDGVMKSDILLVDLREIPYWQRLKNFIRTGHSDPPRVGTIIELAWAVSHEVVVFGSWAKHGYFMRFHVDERFDNLDDALIYLLARKDPHDGVID